MCWFKHMKEEQLWTNNTGWASSRRYWKEKVFISCGCFFLFFAVQWLCCRKFRFWRIPRSFFWVWSRSCFWGSSGTSAKGKDQKKKAVSCCGTWFFSLWWLPVLSTVYSDKCCWNETRPVSVFSTDTGRVWCVWLSGIVTDVNAQSSHALNAYRNHGQVGDGSEDRLRSRDSGQPQKRVHNFYLQSKYNRLSIWGAQAEPARTPRGTAQEEITALSRNFCLCLEYSMGTTGNTIRCVVCRSRGSALHEDKTCRW